MPIILRITGTMNYGHSMFIILTKKHKSVYFTGSLSLNMSGRKIQIWKKTELLIAERIFVEKANAETGILPAVYRKMCACDGYKN